MTKKQAIILGVLVAVLLAFVLKAVLGGGADDEYMRKFEEGQKQREAQAAGTAPPGGTVTSAGTAAPGIATPAVFVQSEVSIDELLAVIVQEVFRYEETRITRNPMTPLVGPQAYRAATATTSGTDRTKLPPIMMRMAVTGIVWDATNPIAVVNNQIVQQGSELPGNVIVQAIEKDNVVFKFQDQLIPVGLKEQ